MSHPRMCHTNDEDLSNLCFEMRKDIRILFLNFSDIYFLHPTNFDPQISSNHLSPTDHVFLQESELL